MYMDLLAAAYPETGHFYEADGLFTQATGPWLRGELAAPPPDPDAKARSAAVYAGIAKHDPDAVWAYQTWIWRGDGSQQQQEYLEGWLSGVPPGRFFLMDQTAERDPIWASFGNFSFFGQPFVWESMNNMGGNLGLVGSLDAVSSGVAAAVEGASSYAGVGFDPEGINQNPAYAEFVYAQAFAGPAAQPAAADWLADFGARRCGKDDARVQAAWRLIEATSYRANQSNYEHHMALCSVAMPLAHDSWNSPVVRPGFAPAPLACAWKLLIDAAPTCAPAHLYDVVDVGREFISLFPCLAQLDAIVGATALPALAAATSAMNETLLDMDELLATHRGFLTGAWVADALALGARSGASADDLRLLEWNAKSQISVWHPGTAPGQPPTVTNGLNDYANKQYSGITRDYHLQRYLAFSSVQADAIRAGTPNAPNASEFVGLLTPIAQAFASGRTVYPAEPVGDAVAVASRLYNKYAAKYVDASCGQ
jgi:alpha-N-acetylglucosaminidase